MKTMLSAIDLILKPYSNQNMVSISFFMHMKYIFLLEVSARFNILMKLLYKMKEIFCNCMKYKFCICCRYLSFYKSEKNAEKISEMVMLQLHAS